MSTSPIAAIVASTPCGVIGVVEADGEHALPWSRQPRDFRHFRSLTMRHPVIMGRKTAETLPGPLTGRLNIVLTRDPVWTRPGFHTFRTPAHAIQFAEFFITSRHYRPKIFVIGGASVYDQFAAQCDELFLTRIDIPASICGVNLVRLNRDGMPGTMVRCSAAFPPDARNAGQCFFHYRRLDNFQAREPSAEWREPWFDEPVRGRLAIP